jgi:autotransporter-associated beta strand protein
MSSSNWLIGVSGNWDIGGYWSDGVPNSSTNVSISAFFGNYTVTIDNETATANSLTINSIGATLSETSLGYLNLTDGLTILNGTAILQGTNNIAGGITMNYGGLLEIGSTAALAGGSQMTFYNGELVALNTASVTGGLQVDGSSDLAAATGATLTMSGTYDVQDGSSLSFGDSSGNDNGTVILTTQTGWTFPTNEYSVTVESGTLRADADGVFTNLLANASGTNVGPTGTLDLYGYNTTINDLTGTGTIESTHTADLPPRLTLATATASEFDGQIVGRITVDIAGAITLTGTNTYTGGTVIANGAELILGGEDGSITGNVIDNGEFISGVGDQTTIAGNVSGSGSFIQNGAGATILSGTNTLTNGVTIDNGALAISQAAALGTGTVTLAFGELYAQSTMTLTNALVVDSGSLVDISAASGTTLTIDPTGGWNIESGTIEFGADANGGTIVWDTLAGSEINGSYSIEVANCTLKAGAQSLSTLLQTPSIETALLNGTIDLAGYNTNICLIQGNGNIENSHNNMVTLNVTGGDLDGVISGKIALNVESGFGLILDGASTYSGGTTIEAGGVLSLGDGTNSGSIAGNVVDQGTFVFANTDTTDFTGRISGGGSVFQGGPGTTILDFANTFTGGVTVGDGILELYKGSGLGTGTLTMQGGELLGGSAPGNTTPETITVTNALDLSGDPNFSAATGDTLKMEGVWNLQLNQGENSPGQSNIVQFGDGTNDGIVVWYTPSVSVDDGALQYQVQVFTGTLRAGDSNFGLLFADASQTTVSTSGTLDFAGVSATVNDLLGNGTVMDSGGHAVTLTVNVGNFTGTIKGDIALDAYGPVTLGGAGKFELANIETSSSLILGGAAQENVAFISGDANSVLALTGTANLTGNIQGFTTGDTIDLQSVNYGMGTTMNYDPTTGVLTVSDGTHTENLTMSGTYVAGNFQLGADSGTGTDITFNAVPAVIHQSDSFDFSQTAAAAAPQTMPALEPESHAPAAHLAFGAMELSPQTITDTIDHLLTSHHTPAFFDFAFA